MSRKENIHLRATWVADHQLPEAARLLAGSTMESSEAFREAVELINRLRSGELDDEEQSSVVERLDALLPDPDWFGYAIDRTPELSAEEIVRRAFSHRPIRL
jgi:uncharacterized protein (DUF1778 family)